MPGAKQVLHLARNVRLVHRTLNFLWRLIWTPYWRMKYGAFGHRSEIQRPALIVGSPNVFIGHQVKVWYSSRLEAICTTSTKGRIFIGDGSIIQPYAHIGSALEVRIGTGVLIASGVYITDHDHGFEDPDIPPIMNDTVVAAPVCIGDYAWLGERAMVLKGVTIGEHSIVGAGAVVTRNIPPYSVAVGSPARVIMRYSREEKRWIRQNQE